MRKVDNENIYKMYDAFEDNDYFYLVVELLAGPCINKVLKKKIFFFILKKKRDEVINVQ